MERNDTEKINLIEIYPAAWLELNEHPAELELRNGKVLFRFPRSEEIYKLLNEYNSNEAAPPLVNYIAALKNLKARMFVKKGQK